MSAERQRRYMARVAADPEKRAEYLMKRKLWRKNGHALRLQYGTGNEVPLTVTPESEACDRDVHSLARMQQETKRGEIMHAKQLKQSYDMCCVMPLCHPFTAVVSGPTGCGKTAWVMRLIGNVNEKIGPVPARIWYYYGEHQSVFGEYSFVHFEEGLPKLSDEVFDGRAPSMIVIDDYMSDVNQLVADIFTKISHHRNISVLLLTQNFFDKNKYARTISLNAHYLVLFKNPRDAGQFATFARQMYPNCWKFAVEAYQDATKDPYGYLLVDVKPDQDDRCRLRTDIFPGELQYAYVPK